MATTKFDKPVGTEISQLNSKIGKVDVNGTQCDTLSAVKTYLLSIHNSLADGEIKAVHMLFTLSYAGQYFIQNTRYVGYYTRINNATGSVSLTNRTGDIIVVGLTSATSTPVWEFNSINSKISDFEFGQTTTDANNLTTGMSYLGSSSEHIPTSHAYYIFTFDNTSTNGAQMAIRRNASGFIYFRSKSSGRWDNWYQVTANVVP